MQTAARIARVVFLVLAFVSYARPSLAGPNWNAYCNDYCVGQVRTSSGAASVRSSSYLQEGRPMRALRSRIGSTRHGAGTKCDLGPVSATGSAPSLPTSTCRISAIGRWR